MGISELTALELGKEIKEKRISVREAVQASLERIHKYEDTVHAYVTLTEEAALAQADEIQKQIDDGTLTGPLAGVPMAIKDNICTEGIETTCSSKILRGFVPPYSAEAALNLKKPVRSCLARQIWMNLRWEVRPRHPGLDRRKTRGIQSMYRADLPVARVRLSQRERPFLLLVQIRAVPSASQVPSAA